ncbi:MAG: DUF3500 domain-containing protein [Pirellulales bacterium]|nr:DUF3500 domain-containing protein [Pirellulales bacterium]
MDPHYRNCPDCQSGFDFLSRRDFIKAAGATAVAAGALGLSKVVVRAADQPIKAPETLVKQLYNSLSDSQRKAIAFDWDFVETAETLKLQQRQGRPRGLLRTRVANNWQITEHSIGTDFYTTDQQELIRAIYEGLFNPEWVNKLDKQLEDDAGGYGNEQSIALFGKPGEGKFELVMTGRHLTARVDGNSIDHMAFGGPIFHGHAAQGFNEKPDHPGNIFWPQALEANKVYEMLDGKQRTSALVAKLPREQAVDFRGATREFPGIPVTELSADQREQLQKAMKLMLAPYREADQEEVIACLVKQGGLDQCSLAYYQAQDLGDDQVWDNWRLEGPAFVWYFRGSPHVHLWIHIGDDPGVKLNA